MMGVTRHLAWDCAPSLLNFTFPTSLMKAYLLTGIHDLARQTRPLVLDDIPDPVAGPREIVIRVSCCGICHTELDEIEGRTPPPAYPVVPGHQVVGVVSEAGHDARRFKPGDRVGVAWIYHACGRCDRCREGMENLCDGFVATGRDVHGGYAEYMKVEEDFAYALPDVFKDEEAAPLLCAGAIGYRSMRLASRQDGKAVGLMGFGASGHLVHMMVKHLYPGSGIYVFARSGEEREFALSLGAIWAGGPEEKPPCLLAAIIDTTPVWKTVVSSLACLAPGGRLVVNAIRKEPGDKYALLGLEYETHLWMEKEIKSVANIARGDVGEFLKLAGKIPIRPSVQVYPFAEANTALLDLKNKHVKGAKVLWVGNGRQAGFIG